MKMIRLNSLVAILIAVVMLSSCKKDDDKAGGPEDYVAPSGLNGEDIVTVPAAVANSNNEYLSIANGMLTSVNSMAKIGDAFRTIPAGAELVAMKSTTKTWRWTGGGYTMWIEQTEGTLEYTWKLYYQGGDIYPTKTLVLTATELKTGLAGTLVFYSYGIEGPVLTYSWEKVDDTVYADIVMNYAGVYYKYEILASEDGSGELDIWMGDSALNAVQIFHLDWNASGHGSWWYDQGSSEGNGTF